MQAMLYVWPMTSSNEVDLGLQWSYAEFREVHLESFVRDVVVPCATEFATDEVVHAEQELRRRRIFAAMAVVCAAAGIALWRSQ